MSEEIYDPYSDQPDPDIYWCIHCERTYRNGQSRRVGMLDYCAYEDCDGLTDADGMDWEDFQRKHPQYPVIPEPNTCYPE